MPIRQIALVAAVCLGTFITVLDISIVNVALPALQTALDIDMAGLQWVVDAYALCLSAFMLSAGPLGDRYGRRRAWLAGVALFAAGSAMCAVAAGLPMLLAGRAVQGVAGALLIPGALSILTQAFTDPAQRAHVIGAWSSFTAISLVLGPMLGGVLVAHAGWQGIFLINLPVGVLAIALGLWSIPESAHPDHAAFDPAGQALSIAWLGALTYGLIAAGEHGWAHAGTRWALVLAAAGLCAFIAVERRAARPVLSLALFRHSGFAVNNFASFVLGFSGYSSLFFFSLFLQQAQGLSPTATGWQLAPQFVAMGILAMLFGRLSARIALPRLMIAGYTLTGVAMLGMTAFTPHSGAALVSALMTLLGIGMGLSVPATSMAVMGSVARERSGMASATMNALRQTGMAVGIALMGALMSARAVQSLAWQLAGAGADDAAAAARAAVTRHVLQPGLRGPYADAMASGFHAAMVVAGGAALLAAALLAIQRLHTRQTALRQETRRI
ncbi:MFS transporter [Bordetella petrii]|uniref:MFS transporter n=1 Tax=Bordetella petrii TaxID=94624 RepID=UPI001A957AE2|nr:MFS transporter [Bordetella petrii]MBO1112798.1 MFS transporter [Bordetella petrii]